MSGGKSGGGSGASGGGTSGRGARELKTRVKTAKGRRLSSTRWLERQLNDPYVQRAKREGYRGRAAFKLLEIDEKHPFLKSGACVVDLGCAPGGCRGGGHRQDLHPVRRGQVGRDRCQGAAKCTGCAGH